MAYVSVPKDMKEVKTRLILNLTQRQVVCFGVAAVIGVPLFLSTRGALGNSIAMTLMIVAAMPAFFFAIYNKDGIPAEKFFLLILRNKIFYPKVRVYETENLYAYIEQEGGYYADETKKGDTKSSSSKNRNTKQKQG